MKKIILHQEHTHAGKPYPAGSEVEFPDELADWLMGLEGDRRAEAVKIIEKRKRIESAAIESDAITEPSPE